MSMNLNWLKVKRRAPNGVELNFVWTLRQVGVMFSFLTVTASILEYFHRYTLRHGIFHEQTPIGEFLDFTGILKKIEPKPRPVEETTISPIQSRHIEETKKNDHHNKSVPINTTKTPSRELTNEQIDELINELTLRKQKASTEPVTTTTEATVTENKVIPAEYQKKVDDIKSVYDITESAFMVYYRGAIMKIKENYDYFIHTPKANEDSHKSAEPTAKENP